MNEAQSLLQITSTTGYYRMLKSLSAENLNADDQQSNYCHVHRKHKITLLLSVSCLLQLLLITIITAYFKPFWGSTLWKKLKFLWVCRPFVFISKILPWTRGIQSDWIIKNIFVEIPTLFPWFWQKVKSSIEISIPIFFQSFFDNHKLLTITAGVVYNEKFFVTLLSDDSFLQSSIKAWYKFFWFSPMLQYITSSYFFGISFNT